MDGQALFSRSSQACRVRDRGRDVRNQAAKRFGGAISTAIGCMRRVEDTGRVAPGQMGGHKPKAVSGDHAVWLSQRIKDGDFAMRGARYRACRTWPEGRLPLGVELRACREAQLQKKAWRLANAIVPRSRGGEPSGQNIKVASKLSGWSSSTRPAPGPIWRPCGDGRRAGAGFTPRFPTAAGRP